MRSATVPDGGGRDAGSSGPMAPHDSFGTTGPTSCCQRKRVQSSIVMWRPVRRRCGQEYPNVPEIRFRLHSGTPLDVRCRMGTLPVGIGVQNRSLVGLGRGDREYVCHIQSNWPSLSVARHEGLSACSGRGGRWLLRFRRRRILARRRLTRGRGPPLSG